MTYLDNQNQFFSEQLAEFSHQEFIQQFYNGRASVSIFELGNVPYSGKFRNQRIESAKVFAFSTESYLLVFKATG